MNDIDSIPKLEKDREPIGGIKTFCVSIEGISPLLHHRMSQESVMALLGAKSKKKKDKVEQTPRQIAEEAVYRNDKNEYYIPAGYLSGAFGYAAGDYKQSNSSRKSYKSIAGGLFRPSCEQIILKDPETKKCLNGYEVDIRKGTNHLKGAVAICRPRFDRWAADFEVMIDTDLISVETAQAILEDAGKKAGIGSFRVSKGGYFGQFRITSFKKL